MMEAELRNFVRARAEGRCEYGRLPRKAQLMPFRKDRRTHVHLAMDDIIQLNCQAIG
jgi:hypothetical protein